jgi:hypothetical protein
VSVRLHLPQKWVDYLIRMPESGMGYQRVDVLLDDGTELKDCLVFNAEEIDLPEPHAEKRIEELAITRRR